MEQHRRLPEAVIELGAQQPAPLRIRPQEAGRPRRAVAAQDADRLQQGLGRRRRLDVQRAQHSQHSRRVAAEAAVAPQDVIQRIRHDPVRRDLVEEAFRNIEAPEVLEAVQQPVGVGGIAARLELPEPDEPRHAGVGRLFEQMLEVAPKPGRDPLGDASFDPALRVDQRVGAEPLDRRRGRQDGSRASAGLDEPADQVLVRLRLFRFFSEPVCELRRRAAREGPELLPRLADGLESFQVAGLPVGVVELGELLVGFLHGDHRRLAVDFQNFPPGRRGIARAEPLVSRERLAD